jgi:CelD/BcsL family acetyltransferase involved in cellulose biosynthesis
MERVALTLHDDDEQTQQALASLLTVEAQRLTLLQDELRSIETITTDMAGKARSSALLGLSHDLSTTLSEAEARRADILWRNLSEINEKRLRLSMNHNQDLYELESKYETVRSMIE